MACNIFAGRNGKFMRFPTFLSFPHTEVKNLENWEFFSRLVTALLEEIVNSKSSEVFSSLLNLSEFVLFEEIKNLKSKIRESRKLFQGL